VTEKGIIFTDVDGTLVFHQKFHAIRELQQYPDGTYLVEDPISGEEFHALDVSVPPIRVYLDEITRQLADRLKKKYLIYYTTGATEYSMRQRLKNLDFADGYILEHGGRILDQDFNEDSLWAEKFTAHETAVNDIKVGLEKQDWRIVDCGRKTFLQVKAFENPHRSQEEFEDLCANITIAPGFVKTFNLGNLTVLPETANKGLAVEHLQKTRYQKVQDTIGIGDDINDIAFLEKCSQAFVLGTSVLEVKNKAAEEGWYVSEKPHFAGINEIFNKILDDAYC
jgi:hydroxymethylpyrimidine pyrophosphatase-like HAD family hydrolase